MKDLSWQYNTLLAGRRRINKQDRIPWYIKERLIELFDGMHDFILSRSDAAYMSRLTSDHETQQANRESPHTKVFLDYLLSAGFLIRPDIVYVYECTS